ATTGTARIEYVRYRRPRPKNTYPISEMLIDKPEPLTVRNNSKDTKQIDKRKVAHIRETLESNGMKPTKKPAMKPTKNDGITPMKTSTTKELVSQTRNALEQKAITP
ncbi:23666_t:CDS:2, partial [Gigaspora margarita]